MRICLLYLFCCFFTIEVIYARQQSFMVIVENHSNMDKKCYPVVLSVNDLKVLFDFKSVIVKEGETIIPSQVDDLNSDLQKDEIVFIMDISANQQKKFHVVLSDSLLQNEYPFQVAAQLLFRTSNENNYVFGTSIEAPGCSSTYDVLYHHGVAIESKLVAYRIYFDERQTIDVYGKSKKQLELANTNFYPTEEQMRNGYGNDILKVGNTCGVGTLKGWDGHACTHLVPVGSRGQRIITSGPIRTIVESYVKDWLYQGRHLNMTNRYTLYAGHRDLRIDTYFHKPLADEVFSTGVLNIGSTAESYSDHEGLIACWGCNYPENDTIKFKLESLGVATYIPKQYVLEEKIDSENFLYTLQAKGESTFYYYTTFCSQKEQNRKWDKFSWFGEVQRWKRSLDTPCSLQIIPLGID